MVEFGFITRPEQEFAFVYFPSMDEIGSCLWFALLEEFDCLIWHSSTGRTIHELKSMACVVIIHQKQSFHRRVHRLHIKQSQVSYRQVQAGLCSYQPACCPGRCGGKRTREDSITQGTISHRYSIVSDSHSRLWRFIVAQSLARLHSSIDFRCNLQCPHKRIGRSYVWSSRG